MGFVYALIAAGLSLIFGLMEIVNFAHGEFLMLAMFSTYWAWALWRLDPVLSLPLTAAVLFLLGFATYHGLIRWVLGAPMLAQIFATFGLAIFLRSAAQAIWGVDCHLVKDPLVQGRSSLGGLFIGLPQLVASGGALLAYVFPDVGASFALLAYVTVALGGFGNVPGTLVAGVIVGVIEVLGGLLIAPALKYVAVFVLYLLVVLWRPQGLFGRF